MSAPFTCFADEDGNVWMQPGDVIAIHASTVTFKIGGNGGQTMLPLRADDIFVIAQGGGAAFQGGNGTNLEIAGSPLGTMVPWGRFRATGEDAWTCEGNAALTVTWDPGDGSAELSDDTDVVATLGAGSPVPRTGTFTATAYGEATYNGSAPWTVDLTYEGSLDPFPPRPAVLTWSDGSAAQGGLWIRTGWQSWVSADDPSWTISIDGTGLGTVNDGSDDIATRAADMTRLYDPGGTWLPTPAGIAGYGDPGDVTTGTPSAGTLPTQAYSLVDVAGAIETRVGLSDATLFIELDTGSGDALWKDGTDVVAERLGGSTTDADGSYAATTYGKDTYNAGGAFTFDVATAPEGQTFEGTACLARGVPAAGTLYAELQRDAVTDELTGAAGPFWTGGSLPVNTATEVYVPILTSDGAGKVDPKQVGPIYWKPNP
jgi:hypothetical protein